MGGKEPDVFFLSKGDFFFYVWIIFVRFPFFRDWDLGWVDHARVYEAQLGYPLTVTWRHDVSDLICVV